jgi:hypothetical protein
MVSSRIGKRDFVPSILLQVSKRTTISNREAREAFGNSPIQEGEMIDTTTDKPLKVSTECDAMPYIMVPVAQLERVKALLAANKVTFWVDEEAISLDGKPEVTVINLGHGSDPVKVQRLLDSIS